MQNYVQEAKLQNVFDKFKNRWGTFKSDLKGQKTTSGQTYSKSLAQGVGEVEPVSQTVSSTRSTPFVRGKTPDGFARIIDKQRGVKTAPLADLDKNALSNRKRWGSSLQQVARPIRPANAGNDVNTDLSALAMYSKELAASKPSISKKDVEPDSIDSLVHDLDSSKTELPNDKFLSKAQSKKTIGAPPSDTEVLFSRFGNNLNAPGKQHVGKTSEPPGTVLPNSLLKRNGINLTKSGVPLLPRNAGRANASIKPPITTIAKTQAGMPDRDHAFEPGKSPKYTFSRTTAKVLPIGKQHVVPDLTQAIPTTPTFDLEKFKNRPSDDVAALDDLTRAVKKTANNTITKPKTDVFKVPFGDSVELKTKMKNNKKPLNEWERIRKNLLLMDSKVLSDILGEDDASGEEDEEPDYDLDVNGRKIYKTQKEDMLVAPSQRFEQPKATIKKKPVLVDDQ